MNVCKAKHLTNMRSSSSDGVVQLTPPTILSLEECIDFVENDEVSRSNTKKPALRKRELDHTKENAKTSRVLTLTNYYANVLVLF
jgi:GTP-binding protein